MLREIIPNIKVVGDCNIIHFYNTVNFINKNADIKSELTVC